MLQEQRCVYEELLHINSDRAQGSRRPLDFIGVAEHFVPRAEAGCDDQLRTLDRITVYYGNDGAHEVGRPMVAKQLLWVHTLWSATDGVPLSCDVLDEERHGEYNATARPLQPIGLRLVALPCEYDKKSYVLSALPHSVAAPTIHCSSPHMQQARCCREACAVKMMVRQVRQKCTARSVVQVSATTTRPEETVDILTASQLSAQQLDADPQHWVFPPSDDDSDDEGWESDEASPQVPQDTAISDDPSEWVFPPTDSDDESWSSDEEDPLNL